jgi:hypothetical protein
MGIPQDSTFGPLLQGPVNKYNHILVPVLDILDSNLHPSWELTIFVKLETITTIHHSLCNSIPILCGMELVVGLGAHAVPSIPLHGSTSNCHNPPLMTLR